MGRRRGLSSVLILGAIVLVVAIFVGNNMGNRVLGAIASRAGGAATPIPIPSASAADTVTSRALWKRRQVLSVATDPAFPDPRITPEPPIPATPKPELTLSPRVFHRRSPVPSDATGPAEATPDTRYTSPPVPVPATHAADETIAPDEVQTLAPRAAVSPRTPALAPRGVPTTRANSSPPPVPIPSFNP